MDAASHHRRYSVVVRGRLGDRLEGMFGALEIHARRGETELAGPLADQAELFGLLTCLRDLGIELVSVNQVAGGEDGGERR
jgi:hypothetical protein